jgi:hypothetical protein
MFRPRKEPDPLRGKRQQLAERERLLAEQMSKLSEKIARGGEDVPKPHEPPVWRLEDDAPVAPRRHAEPTGAGKRVLKRQRRNDKILFFVLIAALIVVILLFVLALGHSHAPGSLPGS